MLNVSPTFYVVVFLSSIYFFQTILYQKSNPGENLEECVYTCVVMICSCIF